MKKLHRLLFIPSLLLFSSCSTLISTSVTKTYDPLEYAEEVFVFEEDQPIPDSAEIIGHVNINDSGFTLTSNCTYNVVINEAKFEAKKIGGNAIKITEHLLPSNLGSSCHRIEADILKINNIAAFAPKEEEQKIIPNADYAILKVYRLNGLGPLVNYDLYLGDSLLCRVANKFQTTIYLQKEGLDTLWAKTETTVEVPIDITFGKTYYLRCGITMGAAVGRPSIELLDQKSGEMEYNSFLPKAKYSQMPGEIKENPKFRAAINGGYSYRSAMLSESIPNDFENYYKKLKSGYHFGCDATYYFSGSFGVGLKGYLLKSSNEMDNVYITDLEGNTRYGSMSDDITISYLGPIFSTRLLNQDNTRAILLDVSLGYMGYYNNAVRIDRYKIKGQSLGISLSAGYDMEIAKNLILGFQLSYLMGTLSQYDINDGATTKTITLDKEEHESLNRLDFSVGLRFTK